VESNNASSGGGFANFRDSSTLATWLKSAGYHTALIGKYLNGYGANGSESYVTPGWDNCKAGNLGSVQRLCHYTMNENGTTFLYRARAEDFKTDVFARMTVDNITTRASARLFFMLVAVTAPHVEFARDDQSVRAAP
jgi:N-acetylglucosamine-6-sulfatase